MAALVSGLSGNGQLNLKDPELHYINPDAVVHVVEAVDNGLKNEPAAIKAALLDEMDAGSLFPVGNGMDTVS